MTGSAAAVTAACAALAAVLLALPPPGRLPGSLATAVDGPGTAPGPIGRWQAAPVMAALAIAGVVGALVAPRVGALALLLAAAATGVVGLFRRRRRRQQRAGVAARVRESCEVLAGELVSGRPPGQALETAAVAWPVLGAAAAAFRVGADVPGTLRHLATSVDGADDLRVLAGAWQVAHRTGQGLGAAVERVGGTLQAAAATRRQVEEELASARATARLVAGLPVVALALGSGVGGNPWAFLLGEPAGLACLGGGLAFELAGLWWIEAIAAQVEEAA